MKSTLSQEIKRFLARIPSGTMDDLGFKQYINPTTALNILLETVKGFTTEKELLQFIKKGEKHHAWMKNLSETLELPENWKSFPEKKSPI